MFINCYLTIYLYMGSFHQISKPLRIASYALRFGESVIELYM